MRVLGAELESHEQGAGTPVVLVHGAPSDYRMWLPHCELIAERHRAVCYSQRYFGAAPWDGEWPPFGTRVHTDDLVALVEALDAGPVHVVGWSYGAHVALAAAVERPELFRSVFVYEPGFPTYVTDAKELEAFGADARAMFGTAAQRLQEAGSEAAVRALIDASAARPGYFESQPPERQRVHLDNARVIPLLFSQSPPVALSCEQLRALAVPAAVAWGERTRPLFRVVSTAAADCIRGEHSGPVAGVGHMWPEEDVAGFCARVLRFIAAS